MFFENILVILIIRSVSKSLYTLLLIGRYLIGEKKQNTTRDQDIEIWIVAKVINEQKAILGLVEHLAWITGKFPNISALIVGTHREENVDTEHTVVIADKICPSMKGASRIHFTITSEDHNAASQLNEGIKSCIKYSQAQWLLFSDVDTRFSESGLQEILNHVSNDAEVIQQSSLFTRNFSSISFLEKGHALLQTRWTIGHERLRTALYSLTKIILTHVVGHGLCISRRLYDRVGGFPDETFVEDIHLGFKLCCQGIDIKSTDSFELSDNPVTVTDGLKQEYSWSFAALYYPIFAIHEFQANPAKSIMFGMQGVLLSVNWLLSSFIISYIIYTSTQGIMEGIIYLILYMFEFILVSMFLVIRGEINLAQFGLSILAVPLAILRRSFPAVVALSNIVIGNEIGRIKTEHD